MSVFITLEGCEAAGKTTQAALLKEYFNDRNIPCLLVREPGSTATGEKIRNIILDKENCISDRAEVMLYAAARAQLVSERIKPALKAGINVICDRFLDSSIAYQGYGRGISLPLIYDVNRLAVNGLEPDITFFIDIPPEISFVRKGKGEALDRIELMKMDFHKKVYSGYRSLSEQNRERIFSVDGKLSPEKLHEEIIFIMERQLNGKI